MLWRYRNHEFPEVYTPKKFCYAIGTRETDFRRVSSMKSLHYKKEQKLKSDGIRYRDIYKPDYELKSILKRINRKYLSKLNFPPFVHCGPKGRSIITATRGHNRFRYHLSLDIDSFFDRVSMAAVSGALNRIGIVRKVTETVISACVEDNRLPQGFPTSPLLSALVLSCSLEGFYVEAIRGEVLLSIYADDILVSANSTQLLNEAKEFIENKIGSIGLSLNPVKEQFGEMGKKFSWLGLNIHPWASIPREKLLSLQKEVYEYKLTGEIPVGFKPKKRGNPKKLWRKSVKGKVVFARSINKNKLVSKTLRTLRMPRRKVTRNLVP